MSVSVNAVLNSLGELALEFIGDMTATISAPCPLHMPIEHGLSFLSDPTNKDLLLSLRQPTTMIVPKALIGSELPPNLNAIYVQTPRLVFAKVVSSFFVPAIERGIVHSTAIISEQATIDKSANIGAYCVIGPNCNIGANTILHPNVTIYSSVTIGENATIHAGTVIGADGFGYERDVDGAMYKFPHLGGVVIGDNVEIGSNSSIDRGTLGNTIIRDGAKIDNQVHISHNVDVGRDAVIIANSMVGGSVKIGDRAWLAPSVCIMNQRKIGEDATVGLQALVVKDVQKLETVMGAPATNQQDFQRSRLVLQQLVKASTPDSR